MTMMVTAPTHAAKQRTPHTPGTVDPMVAELASTTPGAPEAQAVTEAQQALSYVLPDDEVKPLTPKEAAKKALDEHKASKAAEAKEAKESKGGQGAELEAAAADDKAAEGKVADDKAAEGKRAAADAKARTEPAKR